MAEILDCSAGFIGQVESENSDTKYSVHQLYLIAKDFNCSPADFFLRSTQNLIVYKSGKAQLVQQINFSF